MERALGLLCDAVKPLDVEETDLARATGRVLAEAVHADRDFPPTDRSAMDGFAVRSADVQRPGDVLSVVGEVRAGQAPRRGVEPGTALRIFTGAVVPDGADAVVMVEHTAEDPSAGNVRIDRKPEPGQHIRPRGQDLRSGAPVLEPGVSIRAGEIAALASVGRSCVRVHRRPAVRVLSTGDEIVDPRSTPAPHQVRNSNAPMLIACLREHGYAGDDLGHAVDRPADLARRLERGLAGDLLLVTGGVSVGRYDLVRDALVEAGMTPLFHGVAMKPGKPILAGSCGRCTVVGLPGNPLSAFVGFHVLVAPALRKMSGCSAFHNDTLDAELGAALATKPGRVTYHLGRLRWVEGRPQVRPVASTGSGDVLALSRADCFIVAGVEGGDYRPGTRLTVMPWRRCGSG